MREDAGHGAPTTFVRFPEMRMGVQSSGYQRIRCRQELCDISPSLHRVDFKTDFVYVICVILARSPCNQI